MGWFIAQSLAFIVIAGLIGLAIGIWIGWIVWGRRAKGKHTAEKAEAARTAKATAEETEATGTAADSPDAAGSDDASPVSTTETDPETVRALAVAATTDETPDAGTSAAGASAADDANRLDGADHPGAENSETRGDGTGDADIEDGSAGADVVAAAEAVAREAAEAAAAAAAEAPAAAAEAPAVAEDAPGTAAPQDDLRRIEGIGPKIAAALAAAGYGTYARIAGATEDELREAVASQGIKFAPSASTWADQAQYLVDGDEDGLQEYQDYLVGGQERRAKFNENVDYADVDEIEGTEAKAAALAQDEAETAAAEAAAEQTTPEPSPEPSSEPEPEPEPEPQDLRRIEGIGPKIEAVLKAAGYTTYAKIAGASETELREALATGGITFAPAATSWADQAQYLVDGDEDGLQEYQDYLVGGQERRAKFNENVDYADVDEIEGTEAKAAALAQDEAETAAAEAGSEEAGSEDAGSGAGSEETGPTKAGSKATAAAEDDAEPTQSGAKA
ncbi:helix-hairpin-helix domain-containing protein [Promicromonospora sp. NPDC050880]|uniref:helix-hairpin-helix domain-containing protein n=1 Tax=Promicromonospora sp. NPDC050880 TaxID=3364406 RepID=UPI0037B68EF2